MPLGRTVTRKENEHMPPQIKFLLGIVLVLYVVIMFNDDTCASINMPGNPLPGSLRVLLWLLLACFF